MAVRIKHQSPAAAIDRGVNNFEIEHAGLHIGYAMKNFGHHNRCVQHTHQCVAALCRGVQRGFGLVYRLEKQDAGHFFVVLDQSNGPGDGGCTGVDGLLYAGATQCLRTDVKSLCAFVVGSGFN